MKSEQGNLEYNAHGGITFVVKGHEDDDPDNMSGCFDVTWKNTPRELAEQFRKAAEFLELNAGADIVVSCD